MAMCLVFMFLDVESVAKALLAFLSFKETQGKGKKKNKANQDSFRNLNIWLLTT